MAARSENEAAARFVALLRLQLSCITEQPVQISGRSLQHRYSISFLPRDRAAKLGSASGSRNLQLTASFEIAVEQIDARHRSHEARLTGYFVTIQDSVGSELLSYHWHSAGLSRVQTPHLHVSFGGSTLDMHLGRGALNRVHLPTGIVSIGRIVQMLIEDLGVEPIRANWKEILEE